MHTPTHNILNALCLASVQSLTVCTREMFWLEFRANFYHFLGCPLRLYDMRAGSLFVLKVGHTHIHKCWTTPPRSRHNMAQGNQKTMFSVNRLFTVSQIRKRWKHSACTLVVPRPAILPNFCLSPFCPDLSSPLFYVVMARTIQIPAWPDMCSAELMPPDPADFFSVS
jgi:hypothetical protein